MARLSPLHPHILSAVGLGVAAGMLVASRRRARAGARIAGAGRLTPVGDPDAGEGGPLRRVIASEHGKIPSGDPAPIATTADLATAATGNAALDAAANQAAAVSEHERRSPGSELGV